MRRHTFNINLCRREKESRKRGKFFPLPAGVEWMKRFLELDGNGGTGSDEAKEEIFKKNNVGLFVNACVWP